VTKNVKRFTSVTSIATVAARRYRPTPQWQRFLPAVRTRFFLHAEFISEHTRLQYRFQMQYIKSG